MVPQVVGYDGIFPRILRDLLESHPKTKAKTTLKELAEAIGIRQQTVSLYKNGDTQPTPETLVKIAEFFDVSVDYLLTGISSENKSIHEELGLSEASIEMLRRAKNMEAYDGVPVVMETINGLLSDRDFYEFLDDAAFKSAQIKALNNPDSDHSKLGNIDLEGYFIWDLQKYIEEFILTQLMKRGLAIEDKVVKRPGDE